MKINNRSKLKPEDVKKIRRLHREGMRPPKIQTLYPQVTISNIYKILQFVTWPMV